MKNIIKSLEALKEDFAGTISAFGMLPTPVVDPSAKVKKQDVEKEENNNDEKELG